MKTYLRGHTTRRHSMYIGGLDEAVKCQGMDEFGNKYYEDFDVWIILIVRFLTEIKEDGSNIQTILSV
jgi:hypothetical protein